MKRNPTEELVYEALRFAVWAAGEGICPSDDQPARPPEDFLFEYSHNMNDEDYDTLPDRITLDHWSEKP